MKTNLTLKELADIGAEAADLPLNQCDSMTIRKSSVLWNHDRVLREAFTKAILDAIGYDLPKDEDRESFDAWLAEQGDGFHPCGSHNEAFQVWKAGREELRRAQPKKPEWIPWSDGECPIPDTVKRWEIKFRSGEISMGLTPSKYNWTHNGIGADIIAYRILEP